MKRHKTRAAPDYLAYMLRLWRTESTKGFVWRASLESPHTGERRGFSGLESLFAFLRIVTGEGADVAPGRGKENLCDKTE